MHNHLLLDSLSRLAEDIRRESLVEKTALDYRQSLIALYERISQIYELASKD